MSKVRFLIYLFWKISFQSHANGLENVNGAGNSILPPKNHDGSENNILPPNNEMKRQTIPIMPYQRSNFADFPRKKLTILRVGFSSFFSFNC